MKVKLLLGIKVLRSLLPPSEDYLSFERVDLKTERGQTLSPAPATKDEEL